MKKYVFIALFCIAPSLSIAAGLINKMQACQGMIDFLDIKLNSAPDKYSKEDIATIRKGLEAYDVYIQNEIVSPGLLEFNAGDKAKADAMQAQVDAYKASLVNGFKGRYPQDSLFMDYAISLNNCAKDAVPSGQALEELKAALAKIVKLSKQ